MVVSEFVHRVFERGGQYLRSFLKWLYIGYGLYAITIISYFLFGGQSINLPEIYQGTAADPLTFMNDRQLQLTYEFSRIKHIIFFLVTPLEWIILITILGAGLSARFRNWSQSATRFSWIQKAIYVFWLSLFSFVIMFPIEYFRYYVSKFYGVTTSTFSIWMKDQFIDYWINYLFTALMAIVIYALIRKTNKRWWLYAWLLSIPFTVFLMFVQPVIIDPLYNDFYPLKDKQLEEKILRLASEADIPAEHVYEVNMSEKTNALNAYVTGIGSNSRIVLWDTTLNKLEDNEILFVMAHEMAHYVKKHIYVGIGMYIMISFIGLYLASKLMSWVISKWGNILSIKGQHDIASLPLLLLIISILSLSVSPFSNAFSRYQEHSADVYAIEMTQNNEAAISAFQKLTISGLSEVNPPAIVKWLRYGHPTMLERLVFLEKYDAE